MPVQNEALTWIALNTSTDRRISISLCVSSVPLQLSMPPQCMGGGSGTAWGGVRGLQQSADIFLWMFKLNSMCFFFQLKLFWLCLPRNTEYFQFSISLTKFGSLTFSRMSDRELKEMKAMNNLI